jgi:Tfp pilus assembly protein PilF
MDRIAQLMAFLEKTPEDNFLQHALALEYIKIGREQEARTLFEVLLQRDPSYIGSYYHLAKLLERTGDTEQAVLWYERGMEAAKKAGDSHALGELRSAYEELLY